MCLCKRLRTPFSILKDFTSHQNQRGSPYKSFKPHTHIKTLKDYPIFTYIKEYKEVYNEENQEAIKEKKNEYYQSNKETITEKAKVFYQKNKERIQAKAGEKIPCECGMFIRRDWFSRHQTTLQHLNKMEHK